MVVTRGGATVPDSGSGSYTISNLVTGDNVVTITVTAEDRSTRKAYTVTIARSPLGIISDGGASVAVTEGSTATYTLVLIAQPAGPVTITLTSSDTSAVMVTPSISFSTTDWSTAKMVTVTGVDDVDIVGESVTISYGISGGGYDAATLADQVVAVTDNDMAGITSTGGSSVAVTEGSDATYTLVLIAQPAGPVTIMLTSSDTTAVTVTPSISFSTTDWNTMKTVTLTGVEDGDIAGESVTISYGISGGGYDAATLANQVVAVTDNDIPGVSSTGGISVAVTEGSDATYTLVLSAQPTGPVTITLTSSDTSAVTANSPIMFSTTDWNNPKTVMVTGEEDADTVRERVTISYGISGGGYDAVTLVNQVVVVTDNDRAPAASNDASLIDLVLGGGIALNETFAATTTAYSVNVGSTVTAVTIILITANISADVMVAASGGATVTDNGFGSYTIGGLVTGQSTITMTVTSVDTTTSNVYTLTVTRASTTPVVSISGGSVSGQDVSFTIASTGAPAFTLTVMANVTGTAGLSIPSGATAMGTIFAGQTSGTITYMLPYKVHTGGDITATLAADAAATYTIAASPGNAATHTVPAIVTSNLPAFEIESIRFGAGSSSLLRQNGNHSVSITIVRLNSNTAGANVIVSVDSPHGFRESPYQAPNLYRIIVPAGQPRDTLTLTSTREFRSTDVVTVRIENSQDNTYQVVPGSRNELSMSPRVSAEELQEMNMKRALGGFASTVGWDIVDSVRERAAGAGGSANTGSTVDISGLLQFVESEAAARGWQYEADAGNPYVALPAAPDGKADAGNPYAALPAAIGGEDKDDSDMVIWADARSSEVSVSAPGLLGLSGDMISGRIGIEGEVGDDKLVGVAISYLGGEVDFTGGSAGSSRRMELSQVSLHPYIVYSFDSVRLWGTAGLGNGSMDYRDVQGGTTTIGSSRVWMNTVAGGAEYDIVNFDRLEFTGRMEAMSTELRARADSSGNNAYRGNNARVHGARGEFEMAWPVNSEALRFRPFATLGYRWDGGDTDSSGAAEYGGGVLLGTDDFSFEALARSQSSSDEYKRTSYSMSFSYDGGSDRLGLNLDVRNELGISRNNSSSNVFADAAPGVGDSRTETMVMGVDAGYGIAIGGGGFLRPYVSTEFGDSASGRMNLGISLDDGPVSIDLMHTLQHSSGSSVDDAPVLMLEGNIRF